jgi:TctA family transporter
LLLGIVGTDVNSGAARFAFGVPELTDGLGVVSVRWGSSVSPRSSPISRASEKRELVTQQV